MAAAAAVAAVAAVAAGAAVGGEEVWVGEGQRLWALGASVVPPLALAATHAMT